MGHENNISIPEYMNKVLKSYERKRGKPINLKEETFWDAVIISACDSSQEKGYKLQINEKQKRGELPLLVPFHVFADPPGYKIGCGGSTIYILSEISKIYGNAMDNMRFLLIPAGGYSQRLPNLTILGKLFSPLPFGKHRYQMLDLILATYLPFLERMPPGVFLASSDAIISYSLLDNDEWTFKNGGFTALAHPSPINIGTSHGVYVLPETLNFGNGSTFMSECLCVLQKPTVEQMHEKRAVVQALTIPDVEDNDEVVFSDSAFFFDHSVTKKLITVYKMYKPIKCELSSYGDFLQPLGLFPSPSYIMNKLTNEDLASMRSALYRVLFGINLSVFVLKNSKFHHLGTMQEYVDNLCGGNFFREFPSSRFSFSISTIKEIQPLYIQGTVINSVVHPLSVIPQSTIVEFCDINISIEIGQRCIISNIHLPGFSIQRLPFKIPENTLLHTIHLEHGYVTVAFNLCEDIKRSYNKNNILEMKFFGKKLNRFLNYEDNVFSTDCDSLSLWNAKLFSVCDSPEESLKQTLEFVLCLIESDESCSNFNMVRKGFEWISMADVLIDKNTEKMILYQEYLCEKIDNEIVCNS